MKKLRELLQERTKLKDQAVNIVNDADKENRELNNKEQRDYNNLSDKIKSLDEKIKEVSEERDELKNLNNWESIEGKGGDLMEKNTSRSKRTITNKESFRSYIEKNSKSVDKDFSDIEPGEILRAMVLGAKNDKERRALSIGMDTSGGYTTTEILGSRFIDNLRARSVINRSGAQTLPITGDTSYATIESDPVPGWRAENIDVEESEPTFGKLTFKPKTLAVLTKVSMELLEDSVNIEDALSESISSALALELDRACFAGIGAENEPMGIINWDINEQDVSSTPGYDDLLKARTTLLTDNTKEPNGLILHPRDEGFYSRIKDGQGLPYPMPPALKNIKWLTSTQVPTDLGTGTDSVMVLGDWTDAIIAIRSDIRIEMLKERFMGKLQYGFICWLRADFAPKHQSSFCKLTNVHAE